MLASISKGMNQYVAGLVSALIVDHREGLGDLTAENHERLTAPACWCTHVAAMCTLTIAQRREIARRALRCTQVHRTADVYWTTRDGSGEIYTVLK
jgi:hypothetical protein